ncbi:hypothetical protein Ddye_024514 [Dipteronia dyeriana]|uniref:Probable purine permease n=1 Tax=Dipteronia dyeriana TaxID=168575 RepID=A0AAD9WTN8_9ROSI|nr:hypothetical protein Ddye_024514 [Dipteronia dyeriana]
MFVAVGQSVAIILGRLYYVKGGKSNWMVSLIQFVGFPILLVYYCICKNLTTNSHQIEPRSSLIVAAVYLSVGEQYLPVSTVTLISASQFAFNAFFSFVFNSQKFTSLIINCLVLLTISPILLMFNNDSANSSGVVSKVQYAIGFVCTVVGDAVGGLLLPLTHLAFCKVLKRGTFKENMNLIICQAIVVTSATMVGHFASEEWKASQVCSIGEIGLIFEVSSLFCNAISVLSLPVVPALALIVFHDKMDGGKTTFFIAIPVLENKDVSIIILKKLVLLVIAVCGGNPVKTLPGYNGDLPFTLETG